MCECMLAYRAERGLGCRTSVKAGSPSVGCTGRNDLGPQLVVPELTQLGKCGIHRQKSLPLRKQVRQPTIGDIQTRSAGYQTTRLELCVVRDPN